MLIIRSAVKSFFIFCLIALTSCKTGVKMDSVTAESTIIPVSRPEKDMTWTQPVYDEIDEHLNGGVNLERVKVLLLGNSITQQWKTSGFDVWQLNFNRQNSSYYALNLGVSGDRTQHLLYRLLPGTQTGLGHLDNPKLDPKVIVLKIGTNNLWSNTPDDIVKGIIKCISELNRKRPQAKILLVSILHTSDLKINNKADLVNTIVYKECLTGSLKGKVAFLDLNRSLSNKDHKIITDYYTDGVHLTKSGYETWYKSMMPVLDSLLGQKDFDKLRVVSCTHGGIYADPKKALSITFNQPLLFNSVSGIAVYEGGSEKEPEGGKSIILKGDWKLTNGNKTATFYPQESFKAGNLITVSISESVKSAKNIAFEDGIDLISFITDNAISFGYTDVRINTIKVVDNNNIPLLMSIPKKSEKHPVLIFVHGGGWTGGTAEESFTALPSGYLSHYLTDKLGVAVFSVAYRCIGSNGDFGKAKQDIKDAVKFIKDHAEEYNLDIEKIGISGESAGSPLAAIIAQEDKGMKYFIGWNGMYDFVNDKNDNFGQGNNYGQETPSAEANSAIFQIRKFPPNTLLLTGNNDITINYKQSVNFHNAIQNAGGKSKLLIYDGQPHWDFYAPGGKYEISALYEIVDFVRTMNNIQK